LITDNGTNVGINNSSPVQKLDVGGAINIADASTTSDGAIRYHNQDFEGYTLGQWVSLMKNSYRNIDFGNPFVTNVRNTWDYATDTAVVGESGYYFVMFNITDATPGGPYDPTTGDYDASVQTALFYKRGANPLAPVVYGVPFFHPLIDVTPTGNILRYIIDTGGISAVSLLEAGDILSAGMRITTNGFPIGNVAFSYTATLVKIAPY
jgi:hypothetical protein